MSFKKRLIAHGIGIGATLGCLVLAVNGIINSNKREPELEKALTLNVKRVRQIEREYLGNAAERLKSDPNGFFDTAKEYLALSLNSDARREIENYDNLLRDDKYEKQAVLGVTGTALSVLYEGFVMMAFMGRKSKEDEKNI